MRHKIFTITIFINIILLVVQTILSISLSNKGDILSTHLARIESLKSESDLLQLRIADNSSLAKISQRAKSLGFVQVKLFKLGNIILADAKVK